MIGSKRARLLQIIISHHVPVLLDGAYGAATLEAYNALPARSKDLHDKVAKELGFVSPSLLSLSSLLDKATLVAKRFGVPAAYLHTIITLENRTSVAEDSVWVEYEGKYKGVGQFDQSTWSSVSKYPFSEVTNTDRSLEAICRLYRANKKTFLRVYPGRDFTVDIAYLYHNQGASAASEFLETGRLRYPKQSSLAISTFAAARRYHNGDVPSSIVT